MLHFLYAIILVALLAILINLICILVDLKSREKTHQLNSFSRKITSKKAEIIEAKTPIEKAQEFFNEKNDTIL